MDTAPSGALESEIIIVVCKCMCAVRDGCFCHHTAGGWGGDTFGAAYSLLHTVIV